MRKIKKLVATLLAATMVLAMGVTAFAAENDSTALAAGTYTANQKLYKDAECTNPSMLMEKQHWLFIHMKLNI